MSEGAARGGRGEGKEDIGSPARVEVAVYITSLFRVYSSVTRFGVLWMAPHDHDRSLLQLADPTIKAPGP